MFAKQGPCGYFFAFCLEAVATFVLVACGSDKAASSDGGDADASPASMDATVLPPTYFRNPVRGGTADPFLFFHDGNYYLTYTSVDHIEVVKAPSVALLATTEATSIWSDSTPSRCCGIWAPEIHQFGERWYVYYTADDGQIGNHRQYVLESESNDPMGPYAFKAQMAPQNFFSIDGTVALLEGSWYFLWSAVPPVAPYSQNLYIAPLDQPWSLAGPPTLLSAPYLYWEIKGLNGGQRLVNEGPAALYHHDRTTIAFSASGCETPDYALGTLELTGTGGPLDINSWEKSDDPQFRQSPESGVYGPGHNSFFTSPDGSEIWNAYHAIGDAGGSCGGNRSMRIQPVHFTADGVPDFGIPVAEDDELLVPSGDPGS